MRIQMTGVKINIIAKLDRRGKWGASHTPKKRARNGFPNTLWGDVDDEVADLIRAGFIVKKTTNYGDEISLSLAKKKEIYGVLKWMRDNSEVFVPDMTVYILDI